MPANALLVATFAVGVAAGQATLEGQVRDKQGKPATGMPVYLQAQAGRQTAISCTDSAGHYRFSALTEGGYWLSLQPAESGTGTPNPLRLKPGEAKKVDLTLEPEKNPQGASPAKTQSASGKSSTAPELFDEPQFSVAGVTDSNNLGGHGSNVVARNKETLAKDAAALRKEASGTTALAAEEKSLRDEVTRQPQSIELNHRLGKLLVDEGKARESLPYLEQAARLAPCDYANSYDLARAYADSGDYERSTANVHALLARRETADLHHLLADVEEKRGHPLDAVREYQRAAELDASETNLFDWGAELLMHRAPDPAIAVFTEAAQRYARSVRARVGLGVAWYSRGSYEQATKYLIQASDLDTGDVTPYIFLGKIESLEANPVEGIADRLERFVRLHPERAEAHYYSAVSLWKQRKGPDDAGNFGEIESRLQKAVQLNPKLSIAYLQLGILYSERKELMKAIASYHSAIEGDARLEQAHYRLAQAYRQAGEEAKARAELEVYQQLSKEKAADADRERHEVQQFVYRLRDTSAPAQ